MSQHKNMAFYKFTIYFQKQYPLLSSRSVAFHIYMIIYNLHRKVPFRSMYSDHKMYTIQSHGDYMTLWEPECMDTLITIINVFFNNYKGSVRLLSLVHLNVTLE